MSSLSADIYFRWEVIIIQHPDSYFRHIEVSEKIGLQKSPHRLMGGTGGPWTIKTPAVIRVGEIVALHNTYIQWCGIFYCSLSCNGRYYHENILSNLVLTKLSCIDKHVVLFYFQPGPAVWWHFMSG